MKLITKRLSNFIVQVMIAALLLTGAVPSFAWEAAAAESGSIVLPAISINQTDAPKIHGTSALVMDLDTGTVIYEKNADKVREPASLTKILNLMVILDTLDMDQEVTVPDNVETEGSVIGLVPGEKITVENLIYGMMLESGNDAAQVLGITAGGGSLDRFSEMMNQKAKECGAQHTDYSNPNGLNEDPSHLNYTTARDLAIISREAMKDPRFREVVKTAKYTIPATNMSEERKLRNSNACLWVKNEKTEVNGKEIPFKYDGCNGIKTGMTSDAGYCFIGSANREGTDFLAVNLNAGDYEERFQDVMELWEYAFSKYETYTVEEAGAPAGICRVWGGTRRSVELGTKLDLGVTIEKGTAEEQDFSTEFKLDEDKVTAPIAKGQKIGRALIFNSKGRLVGEENLYALSAVGEGGPLSKYGLADEDLPLACCIAGGVLALIIVLLIVRGVRKRGRRRKQQEEILGELGSMRTAGVGMTAAEINELTGREEIKPIPKGPARISDEELTAWTRTAQRLESERYASSRFGGRSQVGSYEKDPVAEAGADNQSAGGRKKNSISDEELFAALESMELTDMDQPRRHGKLTREEMDQVMKPEGKDHV